MRRRENGKWLKRWKLASGGDWQTAFQHIRQSQELGQRLLELLPSGAPDPVAYERALSTRGTEIVFADGVPLVPAINDVRAFSNRIPHLNHQD